MSERVQFGDVLAAAWVVGSLLVVWGVPVLPVLVGCATFYMVAAFGWTWVERASDG